MKTPLRLALALATCALLLRAQTAPSGQSPIKPYDAAQQKRLAWFTQARLGMFVHWGLYSIPAGQWPGRASTRRGEWIMQEENLSSADYEKLAAQFNPVKFDAKAWVAVAKAAGMNYLVVTTKHHDGFCLFPSALTTYDIADATPFRRDPIKELADACREAGLVFCVYYSVADWHHPEFPAQYSQRAKDPATGRTLEHGFHGAPNPAANLARYADYMRGQVRELLTNYGPIGIVWFDAGGALRVPNRGELIKGDELAAMIHQLQPATLINNRAGVTADYGTPEQRIPGGRTVEPFEVCMTLNRKWGYNRFDREWKSPALVVRNIADIASKGGNYLINVGPTGEGVIPDEDVRILREVGAWTHTNAEAIYGTGPTPFGDELGYEDASKKDKEGKPTWVSREEWRCTTRPGKLYFTLLKWQTGNFALPGFPNRIKRAYLLAEPTRDLSMLLSKGRESTGALSNGNVYILDSNGVVNRTGSPISPPTAAKGMALVKLPPQPPAGLAPVLCVEIEGDVKHQGSGAKLDSKKDTGS
ncbi:MAG: alpha-L-fucosidase [Verrucomicrobia bacterium]|nr:alpha-L-fucosidase [Verrucomicrobiota bacterium]